MLTLGGLMDREAPAHPQMVKKAAINRQEYPNLKPKVAIGGMAVSFQSGKLQPEG